MSREFLLGLDVGGGGGRCLLVDLESAEMTIAGRSWSHRVAPGTGGWGYDLDVDGVWSALGETVRDVMNRAHATPQQIVALAATSMRHGMVLLDKDGHELLAVPNRDARAASEALELAQERGEELYERTGHWPSPIFAAARLLWFAQRMSGGLASARALLSLSDWAGYRMTGAIAAEPSQAGETQLLDLKTGRWADDLIASLDLPRSIFPPLVNAGTRLGTLTQTAADQLGLMSGLPVVLGGADTQSGLLGTGAVAAGQLAVIAGTTAPVQMVLDRPLVDPAWRLWTGRHIVPGLWVLESNGSGMGKALNWFAQLLYPDAPDPVRMLIAEAAGSEPGARGMISTLGVTVFNAREMGLPVDGLTMTHEIASDGGGARDRRHLTRAILEGLAFSVRANIAQLSALAGDGYASVRLGGGLSRSETWAQMLSHVMNVPVEICVTPEATALGAAICAGVGAGAYDDLAAGAQALSRTVQRFTPDPALARVYAGLYAHWNQVREARADGDVLHSSAMVEVLAGEGLAESTEMAATPYRPRILVTADIDEGALKALEALGEVEYASYRQVMRLLTGDELVDVLDGFHVFITEVDVVDADALGQLPDLRVVAVCRGNPVNVDIKACSALGIPVIHTPGRNASAVADLTVAYMLMLARKLTPATAFLRQPGGEAGDMGRMGMAHSQFQGHELWGKTAGLIGLGAVGRNVAQRLLAFGAQVLVYDPYVTSDQAVLAGANSVSLESLLQHSDFISLHAPVTEETRGMIDAQALAQMKPGAFLINTARAALVDDAALQDALRSGHLGGAALDVFSVEPPGSDDPLLASPNVIATPHIGGNTHQVAAHQGRIVADELQRLLRAKDPHHVVNPEVLMGFSWTGVRPDLSADALQQLGAGSGPAVSDLEAKTKAEPSPQRAQQASLQPEVTESRRGGLFSKLRRSLAGRESAESREALGPVSQNVREHMARILQGFVEGVAIDPLLRDFSVGKDVTMHFIVTDLDLDFFFGFQDGTVTSALGAPPHPTDVTLKMKADTLDGIFTGRVSGTRAALSGKLSFKGDTSKAMAFQRIQKPLGQLYTDAREHIGDPGDLTSIEQATSAPQQEPPMAPQTSPVQDTPTRAKVGDVRDELIKVLNELYVRGLITATGGNISVRVEGTEDEIWIMPSQIFKGNLRADMMVRIDLDGNVLDPDALTPSSEWRLHCRIYRARPDFGAVVHTHAPQTIILGMTGKPFLPISTEAAFVGELARVPFSMPGTDELADGVAESMATGVAAIMQNHGLVVAGSTLRRAADLTEIIETSAEKILTCYMLGQEPPVLPDDVVATLREIGEMMV
jgi:sugar (pentulose or hexulose) kinase/phosphoglycerate dehydrogenase-like enzyme/ribulose-5-phosphate 4-epimerase/fuculose-1-phosphate aldolase